MSEITVEAINEFLEEHVEKISVMTLCYTPVLENGAIKLGKIQKTRDQRFQIVCYKCMQVIPEEGLLSHVKKHIQSEVK